MDEILVDADWMNRLVKAVHRLDALESIPLVGDDASLNALIDERRDARWWIISTAACFVRDHDASHT